MSPWSCPSCGGGFPEPVTRVDSDGIEVYGCPWCGEIAEMFTDADLERHREGSA